MHIYKIIPETRHKDTYREEKAQAIESKITANRMETMQRIIMAALFVDALFLSSMWLVDVLNLNIPPCQIHIRCYQCLHRFFHFFHNFVMHNHVRVCECVFFRSKNQTKPLFSRWLKCILLHTTTTPIPYSAHFLRLAGLFLISVGFLPTSFRVLCISSSNCEFKFERSAPGTANRRRAAQTNRKKSERKPNRILHLADFARCSALSIAIDSISAYLLAFFFL